jgi:hypothetical protein
LKIITTYWYVRHIDAGPVTFPAGVVAWTTGRASGFVPGVEVVMQFPTRELARTARRETTRTYDRKFRRKFKIVRVTVTREARPQRRRVA